MDGSVSVCVQEVRAAHFEQVVAALSEVVVASTASVLQQHRNLCDEAVKTFISVSASSPDRPAWALSDLSPHPCVSMRCVSGCEQRVAVPQRGWILRGRRFPVGFCFASVLQLLTFWCSLCAACGALWRTRLHRSWRPRRRSNPKGTARQPLPSSETGYVLESR